MARRAIVIGAGPSGIAAAVGAADRGYDVTMLERAEVGASLLTWGRTRFFSPLAMNVTSRMLELLGDAAPAADALLTGEEYVRAVLEPLTRREPLAGRVRTSHRVLAISRRGLTRADYAGHPLRSEKPFRLLVDTPGGEELLEAEVMLDASGGLVVPRPMGAGGLPARGESRLGGRSIRTLGELDARRDELRGRRVLLVGDGHSAANAIVKLEQLATEDDATRVVWAVRTANRRPCEEVANDPLPERQGIVARANALAAEPPTWLRVERRAMIESVAVAAASTDSAGEGARATLSVALTGGRTVEVHVIAAFTGYRPDDSYLRELAVETSPVTEGGARLYRAIANITDCLAVPRVRPEDLQSGEPGFFFVGSRSYGRSAGFLLQTGFAQLEEIVASL